MKPIDLDPDPEDLSSEGANTIQVGMAPQPVGEPIRLTTQEFTWVSALSRHYRKHFGLRMDVEQFVANDVYARIVLQESHNSGNPALAALAAQFLDENGMPSFQLGRGRPDVDLEI